MIISGSTSLFLQKLPSRFRLRCIVNCIVIARTNLGIWNFYSWPLLASKFTVSNRILNHFLVRAVSTRSWAIVLCNTLLFSSYTNFHSIPSKIFFFIILTWSWSITYYDFLSLRWPWLNDNIFNSIFWMVISWFIGSWAWHLGWLLLLRPSSYCYLVSFVPELLIYVVMTRSYWNLLGSRIR